MVQVIKLLQVLSAAGVEFVLVGGAAAYAHGSSMVTQDLDVCGPMKTDNLVKLAAALKPYHPEHRMVPEAPSFTVDQARSERFKNLYLNTGLGQVDFLGSIKGVGDYAAVLEASEKLNLPDATIRILSLSKLIEAKEAMGRPRDIEAAKLLRKLENEGH